MKVELLQEPLSESAWLFSKALTPELSRAGVGLNELLGHHRWKGKP